MRKEENERTTVKENEWSEGLKMEEALNLKINHLLDLFDMTQVEDVKLTGSEQMSKRLITNVLTCVPFRGGGGLYAQKFDK